MLFNSKYLDLKHNLFLFSSLSWQILLDRHLPPVPPVPGHLPIPLRLLRLPPPRFSVHVGLEPATSRPGRLSSYRWATGTFTLTLLFFALLSFLSCQNHISQQRRNSQSTEPLGRCLVYFLTLLFWIYVFFGGRFYVYWFSGVLFLYERALATSLLKSSTGLEHILLSVTFVELWTWTHDFEIVNVMFYQVSWTHGRGQKTSKTTKTLNLLWVFNPKLPHTSRPHQTSCYTGLLMLWEILVKHQTQKELYCQVVCLCQELAVQKVFSVYRQQWQTSVTL